MTQRLAVPTIVLLASFVIPFLAIWIQDKDKFPIRTLAVLYRDREARYLAELRQWPALACVELARGVTNQHGVRGSVRADTQPACLVR